VRNKHGTLTRKQLKNCPTHKTPYEKREYSYATYYICLACKRAAAKAARKPKPRTGVRFKISFPLLIATDAAYLAGILDGEGSIVTQDNLWRLSVSNTHKPLIDWLAGFGHCSIVHHRKPRTNPSFKTQKPSWDWILCRQGDVAYCLFQIAPYMIIKRERAHTAIRGITERSPYVQEFLREEQDAAKV
jgi:hypothetical protein